MVFRMNGFSAFTKKTDPVKQDPSSGRTKAQELKNDLVEINKSIKKHSHSKAVLSKLLQSKKEIQQALLKIEDK